MELSSPQSAWQSRLHEDFPDGMIMSWENDPARYIIGHIEVVGVEDGGPLVRLDTAGVQKSLVIQITGYTVVRTQPTLARVVGTELPELMIWDADIPSEVAERIAADSDE